MCTLFSSSSEFKWWSEWKGQQKKIHEIDIALFDGTYLISELKKYDIYDEVFDNDIRKKLDEILESMRYEKTRLAEEIIVMLTDITPSDYDSMIFVKKLENAKIEMIDGCKRDFFNAEFAEYIIKSKGDTECIRLSKISKEKYMIFGKRSIGDISVMMMGMIYLQELMRELKMRIQLH
ncbi:MAG: hypothetical protein V8R57_01835 [Evtepia sp.]